MPIFRYDSDGYPSSTSGDPEWKAISNIYRWTGSTWQKIKKIYRFNNNIAAKWQLIFQGTEAPQPKAPFSSLYRTSDNGTTTFSSGNTVRLSRGSWTESPTSYRLRIQTSQSAGSGYTSVADQTYNASSTPTAANTTNDTFISYTITDQDALHPSYYIKGLVTATNADGTTPLETTAVLLRIGFTLSNLTASSATPYGATFSWSISGVPDQSVYIYDQVLTIRRVSDNVVVKTVNVAAGTNSTTVNDSTNLSPNTSYYAKLVVTAYDSWFLTDSPTTRTIDNVSFTTAGNPPANTVAPTISPLNNRGYLPVSTTLTATQGTWSNVFGTTVYAYDWWKEDYISGALSNTGYTVNTQTYGVSDALDYIFVRVRATNTDGGVGTAVSTTYTLDQAVAVGSITPTTVNQSVSTNFVFNISHYPTSYIINWGDGTSNYSSGAIAANTSTVNASVAHTYSTGGTYTITVTAQPGSKTNTATITVQAPISITFDANSGTLSSGPGNGNASHTYTGASGTTFTAPSATRQHFTFSTWRNPLSGGDPYFLTPGLNYTYGVSTGVEISRTFFAIWTANTYTVSYNYNGGTGSPASASVQYPGSVTLPSPTRSGHTFNGWYTASSGGSFVGGAGSSYSPTSNITLFAQWSVIQYTVTWNANGGSVSPSSNTVNAGGSVTAPTPTRSGFNFVRWTDTISGDYFYTVLAGGSFTPPSSITMYARWQAAVSIPSGGSVSLTGGSTAGSTITATTSGWSQSPTSYDVYITTALSPNIPTSSSTRVASSGGGSSTSYTITSSDAISPVNIFRAFATASNSAGTSGTVQSSNTITTTSSAPATQPGTPGTPTNGWTGGTTYPFSWTAPGPGTVAGGGAATITNYSMRIYEATNSSGTGATLLSTFNTGSGSSSYTYTSPNAANYYAASVAAINSAGLQGPYSGISQYK